MTLIQSIIIAIVEGLTEFLPVSSTGHMIITSSLLGIAGKDFTKLFEVVIQLGAIMAVVVYYYKRFFDFSRMQFYLKLIIAVIPALAFGALFASRIKSLMESPMTVGFSFLIGGIFLLFVDKLFNKPRIETEAGISNTKAFTIGLWQVLAMIPGVSRSAASIVGGMQQGLTRKVAAEFSFFLAVPTMFAAAAKDLLDFYKDKGHIDTADVHTLLIGSAIAFVVALVAIKFFIHYLQRYGFRLFGWYRIVAGIAVLALVFTKHL